MRASASTVCALLLLAGCAAPPPGAIELSAPDGPVEPSWEHLAEALAELTRDGAMLDRPRRAGAAALERQLAALEHWGPASTPGQFPTRRERLAWQLNARTAWAMRLVLAVEEEDELPEQLPRRMLERRRVPLDGAMRTLEQIDAAIEELGGWKALAATPGVRPERAPLPPAPFAPDGLPEQFDAQLARLIDDEARLVLDFERRAVRYPPVLWRARGAILNRHERLYGVRVPLHTALRPLVSGSARRRLQEAVGWRDAPRTPSDEIALEERGWR